MAKFSKLGIVKLPPIAQYDYVRNHEFADYVLLYETGDLGFCDHRCWLSFHPFCEVIDCEDEELELLPSYREWYYYVDPPLGERSRCSDRRHWLSWLHLDIRKALALVACSDEVMCVLL